MTSVTVPNNTAPTADRLGTDRPAIEKPAARLRAVLGLNAATSLAAGLVGTIAASWTADTLGLGSVAWTRIVSIGLIVFAVDVALVATRARASLRPAALAISMADIAWVVGTVAVLATADLTSTGTVLAVVMGIGVADFAALQLWFRSTLA